ncbi:cytochrome d ubiquinol oxidase subunit II [Mucilaginibacter phyllosphaerae]|uniref:Cytochrome d ubiquinol oxidase subunit II n=1 Tax=Mucilaginibacter phyllosphaerae TaxID=1812349 RepID=A0A4Y8AJM8_9SPHI|nr:cytochrome d ubiquinol oxidase subunit II [Mucilaginibacter phyllosphaerae]MBB3968289.1 cytochrome d ubiquinol oxidase subunit II [Mucilaginibacter phyllosphaerae]TEW68709.1 cytochrome d ubiquinol oxidase subunit II [Mucilaginibacter phyllosphaerae]GGG99928.1 cytochrome D ubiquinol oxidase subunit II [Mucilaginibacter phyllosphaerae]
MIYVVIVFLWVALLLYLVMGGADFGAGIIELFTSTKNKSRTRRIMYNAIGPIWEANHMWLIIAIVILFVGFPVIYATMSTYLHIPLTVMLMGIIARGTALTFRNYDAVHDNMQKVYNKIFVYSSFITPLFLGIIAGSAVSGRVDPQATNFLDAYIYSWLNWFSVAIGFFTVALCGFLAAIYLIGETDDDAERKGFIRKARIMNVAAVVAGSVVFIASVKEKIPLVQWVFGNIIGVAAVSAATISLIVLWYLIGKGKRYIIRVLAGFQMTMILLTTTYRHYPNIIILKNGGHLSLLADQGTEKTIQALGIALLAGSIFILPALIYLVWSFQQKPEQADGDVHGH